MFKIKLYSRVIVKGLIRLKIMRSLTIKTSMNWFNFLDTFDQAAKYFVKIKVEFCHHTVVKKMTKSKIVHFKLEYITQCR